MRAGRGAHLAGDLARLHAGSGGVGMGLLDVAEVERGVGAVVPRPRVVLVEGRRL